VRCCLFGGVGTFVLSIGCGVGVVNGIAIPRGGCLGGLAVEEADDEADPLKYLDSPEPVGILIPAGFDLREVPVEYADDALGRVSCLGPPEVAVISRLLIPSVTCPTQAQCIVLASFML
jgi:hypothetical protein